MANLELDHVVVFASVDGPEARAVEAAGLQGYAAAAPAELDLKAAGVTSVIWAMGYVFDYSLVQLPVVDADGFPVQQRGVTQYPGLYFLGTHWLYKAKSDLLMGVGEDAAYLAERLTERG